jgi:hypothetical protein
MSTPARGPRKIATIIWWALLAGLLIFLVVATVALASIRTADPRLTNVLAVAVSVLAVVEVVLSRFVPRAIRKHEADTADQHALRKNVTAVALCEGPGLFAVVAWMITGSPLVLPALAVSIVGLVACFPSDARWEALGGNVR